MGKSIKVKKGNEVLEIQDTDLQAAVSDGYLPTERVIVANSKTKETFEINPQDLPSAFKDGFSFQDVSKKKVSTDLSMVGGKAVPGGGQVGSSKAQYGGLTDYSIEGIEKYAEQYNKKFEDETGHRELNLNAPVKPKSVLGQIGYDKRKGDFELKKMQKYRDVEEKEITPLKLKVVTGEVKPSELSDLYNKPYGKKIVGDIINSQVPELGSMALESDVYGNEQKWANIAQAINVKNVGLGVDLNLQAIQGIDDYLNTTMQSGQSKTGYAGSVSPTTGVVAREAGSEVLPLGKYNVNDPKDLSKFLQEVSKSDEILGADGGKKKLVESIKEKLFFIKTQEPIDQEIESANIPDAVARVNMRLEKGRQNVKYNDKVNELHFKLGLNYVKDSDPELYGNVMRTITKLGDIPDTDYKWIASLGQDIYNKKIYLQSAQNPELVGKQTDIKYSSYQSEKQKYSQVLSEEIKRLGYGNKGRVPTKAIEDAWRLHPELDNAEIVNDIAKDEAAGGYGIVKSGFLNKRMNAIAEPFKDLNRFYNSIVDSPAETYYNSKRLDYGDQKLLDNEGNIVDRLPSDSYGTFDKIFDGALKIASQVLITRGVGGLMKAPIAFGLGQVPRAAMTANQAKGIVNVGGTFASTYLQTYGNSYIDFLNKTGNPDKAALMATIDGLGTAALETFISPDVKIADKAAELLKSKKIDFVKDLTKVIEGNGGKVAAGQVIKKFVTDASGIMGGQILQEDLQQVENFLVEGIFSPRTVEDRNLVKELINTTKETALATVIPAILGGGGATKAQRKLSREGLHTIAINFDSYKEAMDKAVLDGLMSQSDYDLASGIIQRHKSNIDNAPHRDAKGGLISADRQLEYAFQSTVEQIYGERAAQQPDNVQREPLEEKIKEAEQIKRKIFLGEEVKGLPQEEKVDEVDEKSVEEARLLEIADQALNNVAPIAGTDGNVMAIDGGNLLERAVSVWGTEDVRKGVELSLEKQLQQNRDELSSIENPTEGDREYHNEVEQEIRQKHKDALAKIDELKKVGKSEDISQPIELDPTLPEGYELPGQPQVETEVNIPELYKKQEKKLISDNEKEPKSNDTRGSSKVAVIQPSEGERTTSSYVHEKSKFTEREKEEKSEQLGGGIQDNTKGGEVIPISEIDNLRSQKQTDLATGNAIELEQSLEKYGIKEPLVITYYPNEGKAVLTDGHTRLDVAKDMGAKKLPIRIVERYSDAPQNAKDWTPPQQKSELDIDAKKEAIETEKQQAITEATKPVVDLELLGDAVESRKLIAEIAANDKDGGRAKSRQHERIRERLKALKKFIDCI